MFARCCVQAKEGRYTDGDDDENADDAKDFTARVVEHERPVSACITVVICENSIPNLLNVNSVRLNEPFECVPSSSCGYSIWTIDINLKMVNSPCQPVLSQFSAVHSWVELKECNYQCCDCCR